jgi:hypothetical protein
LKAISFSDIKKASWLQGFNEVQMLSIDMDEKVNRVLHELGVDLDYGVSYYAAQHRNLAGEVIVGYMACGEIQINRKFLSSKFADLTDLMVASAFTDPSLTFALGELTGKTRSYNHSHSLEDDSDKSFLKEHVEPACWTIEKQIKSMNDLVEFIRGPSHNSAGTVKTPEEYKQYAEQNKGNK